MKKIKTSEFTALAFFIAIEIVFTVVPFLGFIPLGFINATTLHIPVILAGILMGPKYGGIVGFVFGLLSLLKATFEPNLTSFVFSPFITVGGISGNFLSAVIALVPRILIGVVAGWLYEWLRKRKLTQNTAVIAASVAGSLTNTILVLGGIYLLFGESYALATGRAYEALALFLMGLLGTSGLAEAGVAGVISVLAVKAVGRFFKGRQL